MCIEASSQRAAPVGFLRISGNGDRRDIAPGFERLASQPLQQRIAIHFGHADVEQDDGRFLVRPQL
jgi:hypothetical protein